MSTSPAGAAHEAPEEADAPLPQLSASPAWGYLLREYYEMYRRSSAGGSRMVSMHQRAVRSEIARTMEDDAPLRLRTPTQKPVCVHMKRALDNGRLQGTATVIRAIESIAGELDWQYGYDKVPKGLAEKYAYAEVLGPNGPVVCTRLILGLVLFAPRCIYPTHNHKDLTESYYCLSGAMSENDEGVYAPGSMIFNPPGRSHRITVDAREPCLLAYAWIGPPAALAKQKMVFSR